MYKTKIVNDVIVKPLPNTKDKIIRSSIFKQPYSLTLIPSTMGSGKTTTLHTIIKDHIMHYPLQKNKQSSTKNSAIRIFGKGGINDPEKEIYHRKLTILLFCGSVYNDTIYKHIIDLLKRSGVKYNIETSTFEDNGVNLMEQLIKHIDYFKNEDKKNKDNSDDENDELIEKDDAGVPDNNDPIKNRIRELLIPISGVGDFIIILDDLPDEFKKNRAITKIIKLMRHRNIVNIICCTQYVKDFSHDMLNNCTNMIIYGNIDKDKIKHIFDRMALNLPFKEFIDLYEHATEKKHNFLMIDKPNQEYYKNFNKKFDLEK